MAKHLVPAQIVWIMLCLVLSFYLFFAANGLLSVRESKKTEKWIYMQGVNTQSPIPSFLFKKQRKQDSTRRE